MSQKLIKVEIKELTKSLIAVHIEAPAELSQSCFKQAIARLGRAIKLPGFRQGKIPTKVIIQKIGIERIKASALEELVDKAWKEAVVDHSIEPISEAKLNEDLQSLVDRFNPNKNISFTLEAEILSKTNPIEN